MCNTDILLCMYISLFYWSWKIVKFDYEFKQTYTRNPVYWYLKIFTIIVKNEIVNCVIIIVNFVFILEGRPYNFYKN